MARNAGHQLELDLSASMPPRCYGRKLNTPAPPPFGLSPEVQQQIRRASSFTAKQPYDYFIVAPLDLPTSRDVDFRDHRGAWVPRSFQPSLFIALELKSVAGLSLPFDSVKPHQLAGLLDVEQAGHCGGLLVEFRPEPAKAPKPSETAPAASPPLSEVLFIPARSFSAYQVVAERRSLSIAMASLMGIALERDPNTKAKRRFDVRGFLRHLGAAPD